MEKEKKKIELEDKGSLIKETKDNGGYSEAERQDIIREALQERRKKEEKSYKKGHTIVAIGLVAIIIIIALVVGLTGNGAGEYVTKDIQYEKVGETYEVIGYDGDDELVVIPAMYKKKPVTKIRDSAFANSEITAVIIGENVEIIGKQAFLNCFQLVSLQVEGSSLKTIGDQAFQNCFKMTKTEFLGTNVLVNIGAYAFASSGISAIELPSSVKVLEEGVFSSCINITTFTLTEGLEEIKANAFAGTNIVNIIIPLSVTKVSAPFRACKRLVVIFCVGGVKEGYGEAWNKIGADNYAEIKELS